MISINKTLYYFILHHDIHPFQCLDLTSEQLATRIVDYIDIGYDEVSAKHYKEEEDPRYFQSKKTLRGPLVDGWRTNFQPIMCSYKLVNASFEVFGLQTKVEEFMQYVSIKSAFYYVHAYF